MSDDLHIRLRHTQGDIGPIEVPGKVPETNVSFHVVTKPDSVDNFAIGGITVQQFKERIVTDWPRGVLKQH